MIKKDKSETRSLDNPYLFIFSATALLFCVFVVIFGLLNKRGEEYISIDNDQKVSASLFEEDLGNYFDQGFEFNDRQNVDDDFLRSDPYLEACSSTSGDDKPSIIAGTVCLR